MGDRQSWVRSVAFLGIGYAFVGIVFAVPGSHVNAWRLEHSGLLLVQTCTGSDTALFVRFGYASANDQGWSVGNANPNLETGSIPGGRSVIVMNETALELPLLLSL